MVETTDAHWALLDANLAKLKRMMGAGSVVRGEVPAYSINVGNPLRLTGWRGE